MCSAYDIPAARTHRTRDVDGPVVGGWYGRAPVVGCRRLTVEITYLRGRRGPWCAEDELRPLATDRDRAAAVRDSALEGAAIEDRDRGWHQHRNRATAHCRRVT